MRRCLRLTVVGMVAVCVSVLSGGCQRSSHVNARTYEYNDDKTPPPEVEKQESEYEMQSPGEMVAPGEMVNRP